MSSDISTITSPPPAITGPQCPAWIVSDDAALAGLVTALHEIATTNAQILHELQHIKHLLANHEPDAVSAAAHHAIADLVKQHRPQPSLSGIAPIPLED